VTEIHRDGGDFIVYYTDWLTGERRDGQSEITPPTKGPFVRARHVFLCAGAVNTTHLLFKSKDALWENGGVPRALGSRYFPNSDSLGVVFDCEEPHEADYGPTITAAMLYDQRADDDFSCMLDFREGRLDVGGRPPRAGDTVKAPSGWTATLAHDPIFDWGGWAPPTDDGPEPGVGVLALPPTDITDDALNPGDTLTFSSGATAKVAARLVKRRHWLLVEDGGYPSDIEPLTAVFRSSVWLRRNRYLEDLPRPHASTAEMPAYPVSQRVTTPLRRPPAGRLRVEAFEEALGGTSRRVFAGEGTVPRSFAPLRFGGESPSRRQFLLPDLFGEQLGTMLPGWFVQALAKDRDDLLQQAAAFALPVLGRLFDELSRSAAQQIDPETRARLSKNVVDDRQLEILARGLLRQVVQILAGSEATVASKAAHVLLDPLPETPQQLVKLVGDALLWAIGYDTTRGHTGMLLTMGRDNFRGKLELAGKELKATLPTRVLDTVSTTHERVLREVAATWRGELRTNPGWTTLGQRITVHSQGGCPMGPDVGFAVTTPDGEVQGCSGLYVMDAAAFPASVGVNPSATIVAIAEYKVEQFIRKDKPENVHWRAPDYDEATRWVDRCGRAALDPLNSGDIQSRNAPPDSIGVLGLTFTETMRGFAAPVSGTDDLAALSKVSDAKDEGVARFLSAETRGIETEPTWLLTLNVEAHDLARLISRVDTVAPMPLRVDGELSLSPPGSTPGTQDESRTYKVAGGSHLRIFVKRKPLSAESSDTTPPTKYFHYHLECLGAGDSFVIDGVKVLHNAPGFDAWHDTSTLYFDSTGPGGRHHLGVLRVSIETFLRSQLPSMNVTGTHDLARKSWALLAFFQYFAWELSEIYLERFDDWKQAFIKLLTAIHV
jgi:hypothetical protein